MVAMNFDGDEDHNILLVGRYLADDCISISFICYDDVLGMENDMLAALLFLSQIRDNIWDKNRFLWQNKHTFIIQKNEQERERKKMVWS